MFTSDFKGTIKVKEWFFEKTKDAARAYNVLLARTYVDGIADDTSLRVDAVLAETEKAVKVEIDAETLGGHYKAWTTWIPKSVIVA